MSDKSTWERFFDAHAPIYDENVFTKNTIREVGFLLEELNLPRAVRFSMSGAARVAMPSSWRSGVMRSRDSTCPRKCSPGPQTRPGRSALGSSGFRRMLLDLCFRRNMTAQSVCARAPSDFSDRVRIRSTSRYPLFATSRRASSRVQRRSSPCSTGPPKHPLRANGGASRLSRRVSGRAGLTG